MAVEGKACSKCNITKSLDNYHKNCRSRDGHVSKCKSCTKIEVNKKYKENMKDEAWVEKERVRSRDKYKRLGYTKTTPKQNKVARLKARSKYPEKTTANYIALREVKVEVGEHRHHWSYSEQYYKDVIPLKRKDHHKAHRFIVYDQEYFMFRRSDNNELLDSKLKHEEYIKYCINNK